MKPVFKEEIRSHAEWLIRVRWLIAGITIILVLLVNHYKLLDINAKTLLLVSSSLFILNLLYKLHLNSITDESRGRLYNKTVTNIQFQISLDFVVLTLLLHFSGSIGNPCIIFYVFHMIIAGIILPPKFAYRQAAFAIFLFTALVIFEYFGLIPHHKLSDEISLIFFGNPYYLSLSLLVYIVTSLLLVYFTVTIAQRLRRIQLELRKKNELLQQQGKIKNEYVSRVTHNIRGDLSTISTCLSFAYLQGYSNLDDEGADFVNRAFERTKKLILFIDDLLNLTKMRLQSRFEVKEVNLNEICTNLTERIMPFANEKGINFEQNIPETPLNMMGLGVSIEEALFNVLHNAVKYTRDNGKVSFSVKKMSGKVIIKIEDNGYGISSSDLPHIFDEFFRSENTGFIKGTGLGLALAKTVIDRHRGKISVDSEINKGTVFTISFYLKIAAIENIN